jgi:hypothetical protein
MLVEPEILPDGNANPYSGRKQSVSPRKALADGGTNEVDNIFPQPWSIHHNMHKVQGDFKRWAKKIEQKR